MVRLRCAFTAEVGRRGSYVTVMALRNDDNGALSLHFCDTHFHYRSRVHTMLCYLLTGLDTQFDP
jgi:hypothetical protein